MFSFVLRFRFSLSLFAKMRIYSAAVQSLVLDFPHPNPQPSQVPPRESRSAVGLKIFVHPLSPAFHFSTSLSSFALFESQLPYNLLRGTTPFRSQNKHLQCWTNVFRDQSAEMRQQRRTINSTTSFNPFKPTLTELLDNPPIIEYGFNGYEVQQVVLSTLLAISFSLVVLSLAIRAKRKTFWVG